MKKEYLNLLLQEINTIAKVSSQINYKSGATISAFEKLTLVHENLSKDNPDKFFANYCNWTTEPGLILIDMTDPNHADKVENLAELYVSIMKAFSYWKVLYAIIFKEHL